MTMIRSPASAVSHKLVSQMMPDGIPITVQRLCALQPDERFCYYIGDIDRDIAHADKLEKYYDLLLRIRDTVSALRRQRRIVVSQQSRIRSGDEVVFNWATGVRRSVKSK